MGEIAEQVLKEYYERKAREEELSANDSSKTPTTFDANFWDGKTSGNKDLIQWVADNLVLNIQPSAAPSSAAWAMRCWVLEDEKNRTHFWKDMWPKLLAVKMQEDDAKARMDDGREIFAVIDRLELALKDGHGRPVSESSKGIVGKSQVAA